MSVQRRERKQAVTNRPKRSGLTRILLRIVLGALGACAAVGILVLLVGEFGETELRILGMCAATACCSLTGLGCAVALERDLVKLLACMGVAVSLFAFVLLTLGIWSDFFESEEYGKACFVLSLLAGALAHTCLLSLARLRAGFAWARLVTAVAVFVLASALSAMVVFEEFDEAITRGVGALSILVALGTLTVPIFHRLSHLPPQEGYPKEQPDDVELTCPRCHRRQRIVIGSGYCQFCELDIHVQILGWEEKAASESTDRGDLGPT